MILLWDSGNLLSSLIQKSEYSTTMLVACQLVSISIDWCHLVSILSPLFEIQNSSFSDISNPIEQHDATSFKTKHSHKQIVSILTTTVQQHSVWQEERCVGVCRTHPEPKAVSTNVRVKAYTGKLSILELPPTTERGERRERELYR